MRRASKFIAVFFGLIIALQTGAQTVLANHGFDTLEVRECIAWEHVLETNDQLYLCRYFVTELSHAVSTDALGSAGVVLRIKDGVGPIKSASVPNIGHSIAAIYFTALDPLIPTLPDGTLRIQIIENPAVFPTPTESADFTPTFAGTADLNTTRDDITSFLPRLLLRLEQADPDVEAETFVVGTGITAIGRVFIFNAFSSLITISPAAFVLDTTNAGGGFGGAIEPSFVTTIRTVGQTSAFSIGIGQIGAFFGIPFTMSILLFCVVLYGLIALLYIRTFGRAINRTLMLWLQPFVLLGGFLGGTFLFEMSMALAGLAFILGLAAYINRDVPS